MQDLINSATTFLYGLILGWLACPVWQILKKIYYEAKKASKEWDKSSRKSN